MLERVIVVLLLIGASLISDYPSFKGMKLKTFVIYSTVLALAIYLGVVYILHASWINIDTLLRNTFGWPANQLVKWLSS